jgi:hypothetical protein
MNGFQQKVVSEKIAKDQAFVNTYMHDITDKRNLRVKSIDVAFATLSTPQTKEDGRKTTNDFDGKKLVETAKAIYGFLTEDGGLEKLEDSKIIS